MLVIGLGNRRITPDSLGPQTIDRTLVTRHMFEQLPGFADERMRSVCALAPGVLGVTGIETMEMVEALVAKVRPRAILCVDSLAARAAGRIGTAIQLTDTGIQPGSGVGNHRRSLTRETLGVPVIAVGMPTVIYAATLARDAMETLSPDTAEEALDHVETELLKGEHGEMVVTPREIDDLICRRGGRHRLRRQPRPAARPQRGGDRGDDELRRASAPHGADVFARCGSPCQAA